MNQLVSIAAYGTLIAAAGEGAQERFIEFFTANIRNRNTRRPSHRGTPLVKPDRPLLA
jgi:hypothetical protein